MEREALSAMDAWCQRQCATFGEKWWPLIMRGGFDFDAPDYRADLAESRAYFRMRSFIHGCKATPRSNPHDLTR